MGTYRRAHLRVEWVGFTVSVRKETIMSSCRFVLVGALGSWLGMGKADRKGLQEGPVSEEFRVLGLRVCKL